MFVHDIIKIKYVRLGYLPDWPPHLLADDEMCDAFLNLSSALEQYKSNHEEIGDYDENNIDVEEVVSIWEKETDNQFFRDYYYLQECKKDAIDYKLKYGYRNLVYQLYYHIDAFKKDLSDSPKLPDWVYSYMLGESVGPRSDTIDIHDFITLMDVDNLYDDYNNTCARTCLDFSSEWLEKRIHIDIHRPATPFGEPHVVKYLRLLNSDMVVDDIQVE